VDGRDIKVTFGKNAKMFRERRGLSQSDMAERAQISISFLSNIERGLKFPQPDILAKLSTALGIGVHEFFLENSVTAEGKVLLGQSDSHEELLDLMYEDVMKDVGLAVADVFKRYLY